MAFACEKAALAQSSADQMERMLSELCERLHGKSLASNRDSVRVWLNRWSNGKAATVAARSADRITHVVKIFTEHLGKRADEPIRELSASDLAGFRDSELARVSVSTTNLSLKILKGAFSEAYVQGVIDDDVARRVKLVREGKGNGSNEVGGRRAFDAAEIDALLKACSGVEGREAWRMMILLGLYSGQRLSDIAKMRVRDVADDGWWRFNSGKTNFRVSVPLPAGVLSEITTWIAAKNPSGGMMFPDHASLASGSLSNQFHRIMCDAALAAPRSHKARNVPGGRSGKRSVSDLSFHCLRHTCTSWLKSAGVSESVAMALVGHESKAISRNYTHIPESALMEAVEKLRKLRSD